MTERRRAGWWMLGNRYGGIHLAYGRTAVEAKAEARANIAEAYAEGGLTVAAARQAAYSYRIRLVAGPISLAEAQDARDAWEREDWEAALRHARPGVRIGYGLPPRSVPAGVS